MKKLTAIILSVIMTLSLFAGCGNSASSTDGYKIAIVQQLDHSSLDEIRLAIEAELDQIEAEKGITIETEVFNGQNDSTLLNQIGTEVMSKGFDAVIPIATTAAQVMVTAVDGTMPVIYAAISDPEGAGLTDMDNVTGVSDALNTAFILDMMLAVNPDVQCVGLLYSNSEPNSEAPIADAKAYLDAKGIAYKEKTGTNASEIITAANSLVGEVDAVFTPTDNVVMASEGAIAEVLNEAGIPHYAGADSFVTAGAFATCGVNYTDLGTYAAQMAMDALQNGNIPEFHVMEGGNIIVNGETAAQIGLDASPLEDMASTYATVATAEE